MHDTQMQVLGQVVDFEAVVPQNGAQHGRKHSVA